MHATTPVSLAAVRSCSSCRLRSEFAFDGIIGLGDSLSFVKPQEAFEFKNNFEVQEKRPIQFKGLTPIAGYPIVYEVSLGFTSMLQISFLLCSGINGMASTTLISSIHKSISDAIESLPNESCTKREYISTCHDKRNIHPSEWIPFSAKVQTSLRSQFGVESQILFDEPSEEYCIYFLFRRMGQDLKITENVNWEKIELNYAEINTDSSNLMCIAVHVAEDTFAEASNILMWNVSSIQEKLGLPTNTYYIFHLPGRGNLTYDFGPIQNESPFRFIQFYTRCGHQLHRNQWSCFKDIFIASRLAEAQGLVINSGRDSKKFKNAKTVLKKLLQQYNCVQELITQVNLTTAARCEVVYGHTCSARQPNCEITRTPLGISLASILSLSFSSCQYYISSNRLTVPENFVEVQALEISKWLEFVLDPCRQLLEMTTRSVLENVEREAERPNFKNLPANVLSKTSDYLNILIAEALITYFSRGELGFKWPIYISRTLGLSDIVLKKLGDTCAINYVKFLNDRIDCTLIPATNLSACLPIWIGVANLDLCGELLTCITHAKRARCINKYSISSMSTEYLKLLQRIAVPHSPVDTNEHDHLNLKLLREHRLKLPRAKHVVTVQQFVKMLREDARVRPEILTTLLLAISETVSKKSKNKREKIFTSSVIGDITRATYEQNEVLFFPLNTFILLAVLPVPNVTFDMDKLVGLYTTAFVWYFEREVGCRGIFVQEIFEKTVELFSSQVIVVSIEIYFRLVNYFLDNTSVERCRSIRGAEELDETFLGFF